MERELASRVRRLCGPQTTYLAAAGGASRHGSSFIASVYIHVTSDAQRRNGHFQRMPG